MPNVVPIFDESDGFIGIWAADENFTPTLGTLAELVGLAEPTLRGLTTGAVTRTRNRGKSKVGKVTFEDGVFVMRAGEKSPLEEVKAGKSFRAFSYHGIPCAQRVDTPMDGHSPEAKPAVPVDPGKWFKDASNRSGPHSPSDFNLLKVARRSIAEWAAGVSQRPTEVVCTEVRIGELSRVTGILFDEIKKHHGLDSRAAVKLFDEYLAAACPKCFHGISGSGLQMAAAGSQMAAFLGGGSDFQRLLSGKCPNCESEVFYCVWHGDRKTPVTELASPRGNDAKFTMKAQTTPLANREESKKRAQVTPSPAATVPDTLRGLSPASARAGLLWGVTYGGFWLRFVAYLVDVFVAGLLSVILLIPLIFLTGASTPLSKLASGEDVSDDVRVVAIILVVGWLYYALSEKSSWQATPGKKLLNLYVTDLSGHRISFGRA